MLQDGPFALSDVGGVEHFLWPSPPLLCKCGRHQSCGMTALTSLHVVTDYRVTLMALMTFRIYLLAHNRWS